MTELEQAFADQDINRQLQASQQALQYAVPALQTMYGNVQLAQTPNYYQSVTPSADTIYQGLYQGSQPNYMVLPGQQGSPSPLWGLAGNLGGAFLGGVGMGYGNKLFGGK